MNLTKNLTFIIAFNIYNSNVLFQYLDSFKRGLSFFTVVKASKYVVTLLVFGGYYPGIHVWL